MRGHRLLFVLAALFALGLIGFANIPNNRYAVADNEAAQLLGGQCTFSYKLKPCEPCIGMDYQKGGIDFYCSATRPCGGNLATCATAYLICGG